MEKLQLQKLFPKNESKQNKVDENKINIIPESNINPLFNNSEQTKETFLRITNIHLLIIQTWEMFV